MRPFLHFKCRNGVYPFSNVSRITIPDELVPWATKFESYVPPDYSSPVLLDKPWADPHISDQNFKPKWNSMDGNVNRMSYTQKYDIQQGRPMNPIGRTGLSGRGVLGRWGPNHAADPIVTRWKMEEGERVMHSDSKMPIMQFCAIQRKDCGQWAMPGGMVDAGEQISETLRREFMEEAMNALESDSEERQIIEEQVNMFFKKGIEIYRGYVDDPRNTDNSWMETVAYNFHDETGESVGKLNLKAGDDAKNVLWIDADGNLDMYANHLGLLSQVVLRHKAHW